jgi:imidazolonepropionase-like amidohydrolase
VHTPEAAREAAKVRFDAGADSIKLYTGLTLDQEKAIVAEARARRKLTMAHVYTEAEVRTAVQAGVDILAHAGSGHQNPLYSDELLHMMAERHVPIGQSIAHRVALYPSHMGWPERLDNPELRRELGKYADAILGSLRDFPNVSYFNQIALQMRVGKEATRQLYAAGCRIIMGTDSGTPGNFHSESVWREMEALVRLAGIPPMEVIVGTTRDAAAAIRVNTGLIVPGRLADIILVKGNPLEHIVYVQNVALVIKDGAVQSGAAPKTLSTR